MAKMPKNKGKGGKNRRRGKNENDQLKRELDLKEDGQEYAQVAKILGNGRVRCLCFDGKERLCNIRGKMRKKVWIGVGDIVLVGLRDFKDDQSNIIFQNDDDAEVIGGEDGTTDPLGIPPQQDYRGFSDLETTSDEDDSDEEDDDDEDDDYFAKYNLGKQTGYSSSKPTSNKKDFSIDNI